MNMFVSAILTIMKKTIGILFIMLGLFTFSCPLSRAQKYDNVNVHQFEKLILNPEVQLLDSRTQAEFDEAHIKGAILIDVNEADFKEKALKILSKDKRVAVYCRSGRRSRIAAEILAKEGYKVTNLDEGIISWNAAKKPTQSSNDIIR